MRKSCLFNDCSWKANKNEWYQSVMVMNNISHYGLISPLFVYCKYYLLSLYTLNIHSCSYAVNIVCSHSISFDLKNTINIVFNKNKQDISFITIDYHFIQPGMGEIVNIYDLNFRNYHIDFCNHNIDINYYCISFWKFDCSRSEELIQMIRYNLIQIPSGTFSRYLKIIPINV